MRRFLVLLLGLSFAPLLPAAETDLIIPASAEEMEKVLEEDDACHDCGVVTDIQKTKSKDSLIPAEDASITLTVVEISPGGVVEEPLEAFASPEEPWQITIRFGDEFVVHEQNARPSVKIGDRVQVVSGRVVQR